MICRFRQLKLKLIFTTINMKNRACETMKSILNIINECTSRLSQAAKVNIQTLNKNSFN